MTQTQQSLLKKYETYELTHPHPSRKHPPYCQKSVGELLQSLRSENRDDYDSVLGNYGTFQDRIYMFLSFIATTVFCSSIPLIPRRHRTHPSTLRHLIQKNDHIRSVNHSITKNDHTRSVNPSITKIKPSTDHHDDKHSDNSNSKKHR